MSEIKFTLFNPVVERNSFVLSVSFAKVCDIQCSCSDHETEAEAETETETEAQRGFNIWECSVRYCLTSSRNAVCSLLVSLLARLFHVCNEQKRCSLHAFVSWWLFQVVQVCAHQLFSSSPELLSIEIIQSLLPACDTGTLNAARVHFHSTDTRYSVTLF